VTMLGFERCSRHSLRSGWGGQADIYFEVGCLAHRRTCCRFASYGSAG
jgi:hypothetical protein